jgi:hypothetical protein
MRRLSYRSKNSCMQYFLGLIGYRWKVLLDSSWPVCFRKLIVYDYLRIGNEPIVTCGKDILFQANGDQDNADRVSVDAGLSDHSDGSSPALSVKTLALSYTSSCVFSPGHSAISSRWRHCRGLRPPRAMWHLLLLYIPR